MRKKLSFIESRTKRKSKARKNVRFETYLTPVTLSEVERTRSFCPRDERDKLAVASEKRLKLNTESESSRKAVDGF